MLEIKKDISSDKKTKRRRVVLACEGCRQRKTRCDGIQPTCGICQKRNIPCVYGKRYTRAHVSVDYVKRLEEKLDILSNDRKFKSDTDRSSSIGSIRNVKEESPHEDEDDDEDEDNYDEEEAEVASEAQIQPDLKQQNSKFHQTESSEYSTTDAMGADSETNPNVQTKGGAFMVDLLQCLL